MDLAGHDTLWLNFNAALGEDDSVVSARNHDAVPFNLPFDFGVSPRIKVCSEMTLPFTFPSMRNVPVTVSVPSIVTPDQ